MSETHRDYRHPHRPLPIRLANQASSVFGLKTTLTRSALVDAACRAEGLDDLGAPDLGPLDVLIASIDAEAHLHPVGRRITADRLVGVLRNRLRTNEILRRHPSILSRPITRPIVITGLQRTGTTHLHRLLAADPDARALRSWEALNPAPFDVRAFVPGQGAADARRQRFARTAERGLRWMAPDFFAVHPVEADAPEEEVLLLDQSLLSTVPEATLRVPSFSAWLEQQDQHPAYETLRRQLQLLDAACPRAWWVLKTPHHLEWLDVLLDVFPDAIVVHTHRDPTVTLASFCSMVAHGRGVFSDQVDPHEIGRDWLRKVGRMMDRAMEVRGTRAATFVDVRYEDLLSDPIGQIRRIYAAAERPLSQGAVAAMGDTLTVAKKDRHGVHRYALEDFGLDTAQVADRFAAYRERFLT